ncbi:alpha-ketoglutarate-dependent 2,4-dichlorophenoxyacetate dioxygenase [Rhodotorula toruloides]|uniref:Alpha-ketoglutarate-dependent 2,4-dichlorophenoxyacetate dioxygenase n=1 Tax=Rhodotorula toruloides TaxID=5286 RepID=A0A2S9ZYX8_RHOTO|nr:alpha-ketoglutarate-dependent 2,4-dichlorophenoxyacetate dioxygenase [Rhodotorula toruloides]
MSTEVEHYKGFTVKPILPGFGAEVAGVPFDQVPLPQETIDALIELSNKYAVLIFRDTGLDDARHVKFSQQLGELEVCPKFGGPDQPDRFSSRYLFDAGNMNLDGSIVKEGTRRWQYNKGNALPHTDSSFNQHRSKYSLLLAHLVPSVGGNTDFFNVRQAYADLPEEKKEVLRELVIEHDLWHSRKIAAPEEFQTVTAHEMAAKQPAYHKFVQTAPNGNETLFIAAHAKRVVGPQVWDLEKSQKLIWELIDHCTKPEQYMFSAKWNGPGDMVWWDNRTSMHRATPFSDQMERRDMRRTTVFDDGPYAQGAMPPMLDMPAA